MASEDATSSQSRSWKEVAKSKQAERDAKVIQHSAAGAISQPVLVDSRTIELTAIDDIETLLKLQLDNQITAEQITTAYIQNACVAQGQTNCLTETHFDAAIKTAKSLDAYRRDHGNLIGPLHGIPISLKDQFNVQGLDTSLGYAGRTFAPATENAQIVDTVTKAGAVIITKTNVPQSIMWCETENPIWGLTTHPVNPRFTPGGSSGGEAALLALHGSLIGFGTDLGGSIRIPSHMTGLWGLRPGSNRLSYRGVPVSTEGQQHVPSSVGPMTRSFSSLLHITKLLVEAEPWKSDPQCPPLPWRENIFQDVCRQPLVVAVMADDGVVRPHPPIQRVLREYSTLLQAAGCEIVEWDPHLHTELIAIMDAYYTADGCEDLLRDINKLGEPMIPRVEQLVKDATPISVYEYWQLNKRKIAAQQAYHDQWTNLKSPSGKAIDVLLMPTMPHTAVPHRACSWVGYTKVFNILDYTALSFPAGKAVEHLDANFCDPRYEPRNRLDAENWARYDPGGMEGLPVGLQLVGRRFEEEKVLAVASRIDALITQQRQSE